MNPTASFYRRPLPAPLVPFSSDEGRLLFREALADGAMEGYFAVAEQFHTQSDPAFCGLGTLVVALNALAIDPGRLWKGPWRWYGEEMLDCCAPLERVREKGLSLDQLACLARCNGAKATLVRAEASSVDALREAIARVSSRPLAGVLVAGYSRRVLGQTGDGHFSPVSGLHRARDLALVLDVARFKYPPHWVPVPLLFEAMRTVDSTTGRGRGWVVLERGPLPRALLFRLGAPAGPWTDTLGELARAVPADARTEEDVVRAVARALPAWLDAVEPPSTGLDAEHQHCVDELLAAIRAAPLFAHARAAVSDPKGLEAELVTVVALALPDAWLPEALVPSWRKRALSTHLAGEVGTLREQLDALREHFLGA